MFDATIIIAAWNASDTIDRSLDSAFRQDAVRMQVVVVDDASQDAIADRLADRPDIVFSRLEVNGGPAQARNRALELAEGKWIAVLDADDTMRPGRLARMIGYAESRGADIVLGNFERVDDDGRPVDGTPFLPLQSIDPRREITLEEYVGRNQVSRRAKSIGYLKPVLSRAFVERTRLRYDPGLRNGEDCHLIFRALAAGARVLIAPEPDYLYTARLGSVSHRVNPDHLEALIGADHAFLADHAGQVTAQTLTLFRSREAGLREMMVSERVMRDLKSRDIAGAARLLRQHPRTILRVGRQILEGLGRKLGMT